MEHLDFEIHGGEAATSGAVTSAKDWAIVGVVCSGNLEILVEQAELDGRCAFSVDTSAKGFDKVWGLVLRDFMDKYGPQNLKFSINDNAATPAVVSIRLVQALEAISG